MSEYNYPPSGQCWVWGGGAQSPGLDLGLWESRAGIWEGFKEEVRGGEASRGG